MTDSGAGSTFSSVLADQLRADPGRPLVTFYDEATGERVELSVATYANWVAKTASLFVDELDLERGQRVRIDLPTHWLTPVFLGAAWSCGLEVLPGPAAAEDPPVELVICGPDGVGAYADGQADAPVLASALLPLGVRFGDPLPDGVLDYGAEVWAQPDAFIPYDPPTADDSALPGVSQGELIGAHLVAAGGVAARTRLLTTENPAGPEGPGSLVSQLAAGGSTIWVRHAQSDTWPDRYAAERPDLTRG